MTRCFISGALFSGLIILASSQAALGHTPLCSCYDNSDGTILCDGGFSDGSSAEGTPVKVLGVDGKLLIDGKMNQDE